ncbi:MAG: cysteine desulfurase [Clostridiales bacterium]|nr:cysteine desulfurase [Clostridiales bacterium]MCD8132632.1 cysteine desulfurase [Clostridiales bacterium]
MQIYLDNSATTACSEAAADLVARLLTEEFGNPSSMHVKGVEAEKYVKTAAADIAATLRCKEKEIVFTSGGTESNNLAILGSAMANRRSGKHIITTAIEHPSVKNTMLFLEEQGFEISWLSVDADGEISLRELSEALRDDTILVSVMMVNNEIGSLQPVAEAGRLIHERNPETVFHVDAVQAYGKFRIAPKKMNVDLLSVSGHKIHGPKGVGFLYIREKTKIRPILFGGGQQKNMRSGTINAPGIAGMGVAAREIYKDLDTGTDRMYALKEYFSEKLLTLERVSVNGKTGRDSAPHIVSASFPGVRSEVLLHALEDRGIYVSAGSACASAHPSDSSTLAAIGLDRRHQESTLRFSFSIHTTKEELDRTLEALAELLPVLRRYRRF